jgi:acetyl-CoA C-acetyltransferase/acetyl-CoA acyltransferase
MKVFLYEAVRSPRGKARENGGLADLKPDELVAELVSAIRAKRANIAPDILTIGTVGQVGCQGGNIALVSKFRANLPNKTVTHTLNNYCVSGLSAVGQAANTVALGQAETALAGGVEMLSKVAFLGDKAAYYSDTTLPLSTRYLPVALAADRLATQLGITREQMDAAALLSQQRAQQAEGSLLTKSLITINGLDRDECIRPTTAQGLAELKPAFAGLKEPYAEVLGENVEHLHTIAHAPPMADGAALILLGGEKSFPVKPRARIVAFADAAADPEQSLTAGLVAMERVLAMSSLQLKDMDKIEFMESFAVTIARFYRDYKPSMEQVNIGGGHLAKGHPLGASGAILLSTLLDALDFSGGKYGLVVTTGASGAGSAMIVERVEG